MVLQPKSILFPLLFVSIILFENASIIETTGSEEDNWFGKFFDKYPLGIANIIVNRGESNPLQSMESALNIFSNTTNEQQGRFKKAHQAQILQPEIPEFVPFPCSMKQMRSSSKPTNIHTIRPGDVDVVAALGDSLTAGLGALATNALESFEENRSLAAFIGGLRTWREFTTLPNLLKVMNPKLYGFSYGDGPSGTKEAGFNVAESGSVSHYLYHEACALVEKMKGDSNVDFQNDWKLVTIAIGTNDFCSDSCWVRNFTRSVEGHRQDLLRTFRFLRDNMPRTIVNFMQTIGIQYLVREGFPSVRCTLSRPFQCHCLLNAQQTMMDSIFSMRIPQYLDLVREWQKVDREVHELAEFRDKDDFVILLQPILTNMVLPSLKDSKTGKEAPDLTYWAPDCFHYTQKMNSKLAVAAWNSLFTPDGNKSTDAFTICKSFVCPTEQNPYICTWKNSIHE